MRAFKTAIDVDKDWQIFSSLKHAVAFQNMVYKTMGETGVVDCTKDIGRRSKAGLVAPLFFRIPRLVYLERCEATSHAAMLKNEIVSDATKSGVTVITVLLDVAAGKSATDMRRLNVALGQENRPGTFQTHATTAGSKKSKFAMARAASAKLPIEPPSSTKRPTCCWCQTPLDAVRGYIDYTLKMDNEEVQHNSKRLRADMFDTVALCDCTGRTGHIKNMPHGAIAVDDGARLAIRPRNRHGSLSVHIGAKVRPSEETLANMPYMVRLVVNAILSRALDVRDALTTHV